MWANEKDWSNFQKLLSPRVELRAREIALSRNEDPDDGLDDLGPRWFLYVEQASEELTALGKNNETESDEEKQNIINILDQQLIDSLLNKSLNSSQCHFARAAGRIKDLRSENHSLKSENKLLWEHIYAHKNEK